ncbi:AAA family ATPase [Prevotella melaninogenica]|uniref:AAA family ATPase n=1 Tax=Prevotella melaninogenica TaxID=28132 RepID=UPI001C60CA3D|nr:BT4734/BF3469 family protein [Prevotella melaninogenica]MBW4895952.1 AAA family ATPase [Prevotella melaninogenica]
MSFKKLDTDKFIKAAKEYNAFDGYKCGVKSIDDIMRIDKQTLTTLVATPASGKSTFTNFYGYQMAKFNNWKTLYIAEETPQDRQCRMLSILFDSAAKASEFSVIYDYDLSDWQELLNMIKDAKETYGVDMVILDNFMMLKNLITGNDSETEKIGRALSALKKAAIDTDTAIILVAHPTKLLEGQEVTAYSVNGSANFFNISDYMFSLAVTDRENYETTIKVLKVRDSAKGVMGGKCTLKYNPVHFTYSDTDSDTDSSTEDTSTPSQHDTPKGINKEIATDVMKAIMEEEAKQEDSQPAGTTKAATQQTAVQPASKEVKKEKQQEAKEEKQQAAKEEAKQEEKQEEKQAQRITPDFIHNTKVSIMEQHKVLEISSLYNAIKTGRKHKEEIEAVRKIDRQANESEYRQAKDNILSFIPSCVCKGKTGKAKNVEHVNPLIAVDIDAKDNEGVTLETMRTKINSLPYIMYSSLSVGGKGMYALLPIAEENKNDFKAVFNALNEDFKALGLTLDGSCVNVNRERYMSYDDDEYWNTKCEIYTKKINIPTQAHDTHKRVESSAKTTLTEKDKQKVDLMIEDIKANKIQLTKNHTDTLGLGNAIANVWGEEGRGLFHLIRSQREGYDEYKTDKTFDDMLYNNGDNERYGLGLIFTKYKEAKGQIQVN